MKAGRVYALIGAGPTRQLVAFDPATFLQIASLDIPDVTGRAGSLIRWADHRLALPAVFDVEGMEEETRQILETMHPGTAQTEAGIPAQGRKRPRR